MTFDIWFLLGLGSLISLLFWIYGVVKRIWGFNPKVQKPKNIDTLIILGSGGHTSEMFKLCSSLNWKTFYPRTYIVADSDSNSIERLKVKDPEGHLIKTKRSRIVGQSYITSVFTTSAAFVSSFEILNKHKPELILCNGPGTCLPMVVLGWAYKKMGLLSSRTKIIYIESICRVKTLSLTAKLVGPFVDHTLVQWPELALRYPNTQYIDRFI